VRKLCIGRSGWRFYFGIATAGDNNLLAMGLVCGGCGFD